MNLYTLKTKIRRWPPVDKGVHTLRKSALYSPLYKLLQFLKLDEYSHQEGSFVITPQSKVYFRQNQNNIAAILQQLADDASKQIFTGQITFRCEGKPVPCGSLHNTYFPRGIVQLSNREVFVDCGAFTGDSIKLFRRACNNQYKKIVAFEAAPASFAQLQAQHIDKCICLNQGVWNKKDTLQFLVDEQTTTSNKLSDTTTEHFVFTADRQIQVPVDALDNIPACSDMTFLKMDIEGAELNALKGAEKTIRKNRPTLAISIYHSDKDLLEIPRWIMDLGLDYSYYVRQHAEGFVDVIFYAIPNK